MVCLSRRKVGVVVGFVAGGLVAGPFDKPVELAFSSGVSPDEAVVDSFHFGNLGG